MNRWILIAVLALAGCGGGEEAATKTKSKRVPPLAAFSGLTIADFDKKWDVLDLGNIGDNSVLYEIDFGNGWVLHATARLSSPSPVIYAWRWHVYPGSDRK
jgi:hypothetical protein